MSVFIYTDLYSFILVCFYAKTKRIPRKFTETHLHLPNGVAVFIENNESRIEVGAETHVIAWRNFSKVSSLLNVRNDKTVELTFEILHPELTSAREICIIA